MEMSDQQAIYDSLVRRIFAVEDITLGTSQQRYLVRYRGRLYHDDSAAAYDQLSNSLKPYGVTPLFRIEDGRQAIILVPGLPNPKPSNPWINLVLFIATVLSVGLTGASFGLDQPLSGDIAQDAWTLFNKGWPFAVSLLLILGAHEFGHYLVGRYHGVHVTLPYFIPFPFSPFGTMGAFINMKETPKNRRVLLDIGIAGPLAGLVVSIPVVLLGLSLSKLDFIPTNPPAGMFITLEGNSILYLALKYLTFGKLLPEPTSFGDLSPVVYWLRYFFTGSPMPFGALDVTIHPVAWAGWAGILVTSLNLIPAGQLDGGHIVSVLLGEKRIRQLYPFVLGVLVLLGFVWNGWWIWAALVFFLGRVIAEPLDGITQLDNRRRFLAILAVIIFFLVFTPVPLVALM